MTPSRSSFEFQSSCKKYRAFKVTPIWSSLAFEFQISCKKYFALLSGFVAWSWNPRHRVLLRNVLCIKFVTQSKSTLLCRYYLHFCYSSTSSYIWKSIFRKFRGENFAKFHEVTKTWWVLYDNCQKSLYNIYFFKPCRTFFKKVLHYRHFLGVEDTSRSATTLYVGLVSCEMMMKEV